MATKIKLSGQEIRRLKNDYRDCCDIEADFERAREAGVPNIDELQAVNEYNKQRIVKLLSLSGEVVES